MRDVRRAATKLEEKNIEDEHEKDQTSSALVGDNSIIPSDDHDFSRRDFSSTTAFQLACDNQYVIRVKDMGNKSGKKNQWTVADVKKAIKQKNEQSENSYVQDKVDLKGVRSPSAVDTNDVEAVETTYLAAVKTSRVPSNQAGDITAEDEKYSDDNVTGNVDNNIALAEHLKKKSICL